jgi:hypothetical protein
MSLYSDWKAIASEERAPAESEKFWSDYFEIEKQAYKMLLKDSDKVYQDKFSVLADLFHMPLEHFAGFMDGISTSLKTTPDVEALTPESDIKLDIDFEKLLFNMMEYKADWLVALEEWDNVFSRERRDEIAHEFKTSKIFVNTNHIGRNDPCPCGSGKKYKKCCGMNA